MKRWRAIEKLNSLKPLEKTHMFSPLCNILYRITCETQHTCFSALVGSIGEILVDICVEKLNVFEAMSSAVSVIFLVNVAVTSDSNGVAVAAGRV